MTRLAESDPSEHYECHLNWHLADDQQEGENVWTLFDELMSEKMTLHQEEAKQFELSFMVLEEHDLQQLELRKSTCLVPDDWENTESTDVHDV